MPSSLLHCVGHLELWFSGTFNSWYSRISYGQIWDKTHRWNFGSPLAAVQGLIMVNICTFFLISVQWFIANINFSSPAPSSEPGSRKGGAEPAGLRSWGPQQSPGQAQGWRGLWLPETATMTRPREACLEVEANNMCSVHQKQKLR